MCAKGGLLGTHKGTDSSRGAQGTLSSGMNLKPSLQVSQGSQAKKKCKTGGKAHLMYVFFHLSS